MSVESVGLGHDETPRASGANRKRLARQTYSVDEAAELLGISRNTAFVLARENKLPVPVTRVGRRLLLVRAALDKFLSGEATTT
jgi:excisionase family DNA binding protein